MSGNRAVAELLRNHPGLQIRLELRHWRDVERMVRNRQVDIGFGEIARRNRMLADELFRNLDSAA